MKAVLLTHLKRTLKDDRIVEIVIWRVPRPVPGSLHYYKYSFFYGRPGERLLGYDNERGKGDHRHIGGREEPYRFTTIESLIDEFLALVPEWSGDDEANGDH